MGARVGVAEVVDVAGRDGRQASASSASCDELRQDARLHVEVRVLQLDVDVVLAEGLRQAVELGLRVASAGSPRAPCRHGR